MYKVVFNNNKCVFIKARSHKELMIKIENMYKGGKNRVITEVCKL